MAPWREPDADLSGYVANGLEAAAPHIQLSSDSSLALGGARISFKVSQQVVDVCVHSELDALLGFASSDGARGGRGVGQRLPLALKTPSLSGSALFSPCVASASSSSSLS
ncbi:hypothetical protein NL676_019362 [Syzygium grande]|nr:hypothetical protein NL676_019362 [Syzygium grande]